MGLGDGMDYLGFSILKSEYSCSIQQEEKMYFIIYILLFHSPDFVLIASSDIEDLPRHIQEQLFDEILDRDVQNGKCLTQLPLISS